MRRITWLGHATVLIESGGVRLLTDPLLGGRVAHLRRHAPRAPALDPVDGVLISHVHHDHLDVASLRTVAGPATQAAVPVGARGLLDGLPFGAVHEVAAGAVLRFGSAPTEIRAVEAWHPTRRWPISRSPLLDALGYVVDGVWFAGDTDLDDGMAALRGSVDVALVPIWGWGPSLGPGHLDPEEAARAVALVAPEIAIPIHWGTYLPYGLGRSHGHLLTRPADQFAAHAARLAPATRVVRLAHGQCLEI